MKMKMLSTPFHLIPFYLPVLNVILFHSPPLFLFLSLFIYLFILSLDKGAAGQNEGARQACLKIFRLQMSPGAISVSGQWVAVTGTQKGAEREERGIVEENSGGEMEERGNVK